MIDFRKEHENFVECFPEIVVALSNFAFSATQAGKALDELAFAQARCKRETDGGE